MARGLIPQEIIDDIAARLDIVELISQYVPLKRQGRNLQGLCPFHNEKTPSFVVSPDKQMFHCFGCGVGGNAFSFIMQREGLTFPEAIERLALKAGVSLPNQEEDPVQKKLKAQRARQFRINETATLFFQRGLSTKEGQGALNYLKSRGLTQETIENFQLGFASNDWTSLINFFSKKGVEARELVELGLALPGKQPNNYFDRFRNRIVFPIWDHEGRVVAFGGRVLDDTLPKYLNSPDTPLFNKSQHLYGVNIAKQSIRQEDLALIVEGYMDTIICHQNGLLNTVASLGTAFTKEQAKLLMRHTYQIAILYDGDAAGSKATLRGLNILTDLGCDVRVVSLPEGQDPDDYLRAKGPESLKKLISQGKGLIEYKLLKALEDVNASSIIGKTKAVQKVLPDLLEIKSPVTRAEAINIVSKKIGLSEANIMSELRKYQENSQRFPGPQDRKEEKREAKDRLFLSNLSKTELQLVKILFEDNARILDVEKAGGDEIFTEPLRGLYQELSTTYQSKGKVQSTDLDQYHSKILAAVLMEELEVPDLNKAVVDYIKILKLNRLNREYADKNQELKLAASQGDITKQRELLLELESILQQKKLLTPYGRGGTP